jgi:SAM-dependent methyltransferase
MDNVSVVTAEIDDPGLYEKLEPGFDTVVGVNSFEHLDNPEIALAGAISVLDPGGSLVVVVPAHQWLFAPADKTIGHRKRYERREVARLLDQAGFTEVEIREFNRLAAIGWLINKAIGLKGYQSWQLRAFGLVLPLVRIVERIRFLPGLSLIAIARKPTTEQVHSHRVR